MSPRRILPGKKSTRHAAIRLSLLEGLSEHDWFRQPSEGVTHVAWQVGHLAAAQYSLGLVRLRGERPDDGAACFSGVPGAFHSRLGA